MIGLDHHQAGIGEELLWIDARRRPLLDARFGPRFGLRLDPRLGSFLAHGLRFNRLGGFLAQPLQGFFPLQLFFALMGRLRAGWRLLLGAFALPVAAMPVAAAAALLVAFALGPPLLALRMWLRLHGLFLRLLLRR